MKKLVALTVAMGAFFGVLSQKALAIQCAGLYPLKLGESCETGGKVDLTVVLNGIINWVAGIIGVVIVLVIIISGIQLAASAGNPDAIKSAKNHITNAILSLVLLISMYGILRLIGIVN